MKPNLRMALESLGPILEKYDIPKEDVVISGSAPLAFEGVRDIADLDVLLLEKTFVRRIPGSMILRKSDYSGGHYISEPFYGVIREDPLAVSDIPVVFLSGVPRKIKTMEEVFQTAEVRADSMGFKVMDLKTVVALKSRARRPKDLRDLKVLSDGGYEIPPPPYGTLKVWHCPNPPRKGFEIEVKDLDDAILVLRTLSGYDNYLGDAGGILSNINGLLIYEDGEWVDWHGRPGIDEEFDDIWEYIQKHGLD